MPLETTATVIANLNEAWPDPALGDRLNEADDHIQLIKAAIKRTFPMIDRHAPLNTVQWNAMRGLEQAFGQTRFQTLMDLWREGTATVSLALQAQSAAVAKFANGAERAAFAPIVARVPIAFSVRTTDITLDTSPADAISYSFSMTGLYAVDGMMVFNQPAGIPSRSLIPYPTSHTSGIDSRVNIGAVYNAVANSTYAVHPSAQFKRALVQVTDPMISATELTVVNLNAQGIPAGICMFRGVVNVASIGTWAMRVLYSGDATDFATVRKGTFARVRRIGNSIAGL